MKLKVAHSLGWFYPDTIGGTEKYVEALIQALYPRNVIGAVIAANGTNYYQKYVWNGIDVYRFSSSDQRCEVVRGLRPHSGFDVFKQTLKSFDCGLYHQHSWTQGCGIHHLRFAKSLGLPVVVTAHVPGFVCKSGTMIRYGAEICDGKISESVCSKCFANTKGLAKTLAGMVSTFPTSISKYFFEKGVTGKLASSIGVRAMTQYHANNFHEMIDLCDRVVVLSQWMYDAMRINDVPRHKLFLCRHGIDTKRHKSTAPSKTENNILTIGFLGRADPIKGIERIVDAVRNLDSKLLVELRIYAIVGNEQEKQYIDLLKNDAVSDTRIRFEEAVRPVEVHRVMLNLDVLAVPSQLLETGPLTVLEALAAGTPVFGSDLGGIREYIQDGVNGRLLSPSQVGEWTDAIRELIENPFLLGKYRSNIKSVRSVNDVAADMLHVYEDVIRENSTARRFTK